MPPQAAPPPVDAEALEDDEADAAALDDAVALDVAVEALLVSAAELGLDEAAVAPPPPAGVDSTEPPHADRTTAHPSARQEEIMSATLPRTRRFAQQLGHRVPYATNPRRVMRRTIRMLGTFVTAGALATACGSSGSDTSSGSGSTGTGGAGQGGGTTSATTTSSASSTSSASGGIPCVAGSEACAQGTHFVCKDGYLEEELCAANTGCNPGTGKCEPCICDPAAYGTCVDFSTQQKCAANCLETVTTQCDPGKLCINGACNPAACQPGAITCMAGAQATCKADGSGYDAPAACAETEKCVEGEGCKSLCAIVAGAPSSVGCSFFGLNMWNFNENNPDAIVVGNTNAAIAAHVTLYTKLDGQPESIVEGPITIPSDGLYVFYLPNGPTNVVTGTALRKGGAFRVDSDVPLVAYQHSPVQPQATNDASCLLPEATLGESYVVGSYVDALGQYPSYFDVIGTTDNTLVTITAPISTDPGSGMPGLIAGQATTYTLNRYDTLQIAASGKDVMGTVIKSSAPVSVIGAVRCAQVPAGTTYCDHVEEQMLPTRNWGKSYVGAHAPYRSGSEHFFWRVLAALDGTTIDTVPPQAGFPKTLGANQWYEFSSTESFTLTATKPFMAYQYLSGTSGFGAGTGDPAMMTSVPVEQFLDHYVILTPTGYTQDYVQIIRQSNDDVTVDGVPVPANEFYTVGNFQVADHPVSGGPHVLKGSKPFGIMGIGYTDVTSYAYPGGMALVNLNP